jgi:putative DNA primase/helicase
MSDQQGREQQPYDVRQYLSVPYTQREQAKAAGALWDWQEKLWYIGSEGSREKLARWLPENARERAVAPSDPGEEFAAVLRDLGADLAGPHPIMDGKSHRVATLDDKRGEKSMFYVAHLDGRPAGYVKNNRTGEEQRWKASARSMTKEQFDAIAASRGQERESDRQALYAKTAQRVQHELGSYKVADPEHEYLRSKEVSACAGLLQGPHGSLAVPACDAEGQLWSVQYINADGTKRFARDSRKEGCFHILGGTIADLNDAHAVVIAEGYATAATLKRADKDGPLVADGKRVEFVAAFDSGNVPAVAQAIRERYPDKAIVIAADNDIKQERNPRVRKNPGLEKATEAAKIVNAELLVPRFTEAELAQHDGGLSDWNDVAMKASRRETIAEELLAAVVAAQARIHAKEGTREDAEMLIQHGTAPYAFNPENQESYFVRTIDGAGAEKLYWGQDLPRALTESGARVGDAIKARKQRVAGTRGNVWEIATVGRDLDRLVKEYDRLVTATPGGRTRLEQSNPELVAARDQAIADKKKEHVHQTVLVQPLTAHRGQRLKL